MWCSTGKVLKFMVLALLIVWSASTIVLDCKEELNREPCAHGSPCETCGPCLKHYSGQPGSGTGMCHYTYPVRPRFKLTSGMFPGLNFTQKLYRAIHLVDLDGDGDLDMFLGNQLEYWENQAGMYRKVQSPLEYTGLVHKIACCDVEDNGIVDFCVIHGKPFTTFLKTSTGGFQELPFNHSENPFRLLVGNPKFDAFNSFNVLFYDLNGDGWKDVFVGPLDGTATCAFWDVKARAFLSIVQLQDLSASATDYVKGLRKFDILAAAGDLDGDGDIDFIMGPSDGSLDYYQNVGDGYAPVLERSRHEFLMDDELANVMDTVPGMQLVDLNGDGFLDFVRLRLHSSRMKSPHLEVWMNQGSQAKSKNARFATLRQPIKRFVSGVDRITQNKRSFFVADFDFDGKEDILIGGSGELFYLRKTGTDAEPVFQRVTSEDSRFPFEQSLVEIAKQGDEKAWNSASFFGAPDLLVSGCKACGPGETPRVIVCFSNPNEFSPLKQYSWDGERRLFVPDMSPPFSNLETNLSGHVDFVDLNRDGIEDAFVQKVLASRSAGRDWFFFEGKKDGEWDWDQAATELPDFSCSIYLNESCSKAISFMDLNDDGFDDFIAWFSDEREHAAYSPTYVTLTQPKAIGQAGIQFKQGLDWLDSVSFPPNPIDIDGDGDMDFVRGDFEILGKNTQRECFSMCLDRGICAQGNHGEMVETLGIIENTRQFQGYETLAEAVGSCLCSPQFRGRACQQCAPEFYGLRCKDRCPEFSQTYLGVHDFEYPNASSIEQCRCNPSFVKHSTMEGSFQCVCPLGWGFNNFTASCEPCTLGSFKSTFSLHECTPCASVFFDPFITTHSTGAVTQAECKCQATFSWDEQNQKCACPAGFGLDLLTESCVECPLGAYSSQLDQDQCTACPTGTTTFSMGGRSIHYCKPIECPPGSGRTEDMSCEPCPQNKYRPVNETACIPCPKERPVTLGRGSFVNQDCVAARFSFQFYDETAQDQVVKTCEEMGIKDKVACNTDGLQLETLPVLPGFWRIRNTSIDVRTCKPGFCVPSGVGLHYAGDELCSENHRGIMCEACVSGFGMKGYKGCVPCSADEKNLERRGLGGAITVLTILLLIPLARVGYVGSKNVPSDAENGDQHSKLTSFRFAVPAALKSVVPHVATKIRILLGFYQVFASYSRAAKLHGEDEGSTSFFLQTLEGDLANTIYKAAYLACTTRVNFYQRLLLATVVPIAYLAIFGVIVLAVRFIRYHNYMKTRELSVWFALQLCFLIYPAVSSTILSTFLFEAFPVAIHDKNPFRTLQADRTIDFDSRESKAWRSYAAFMVFVYPVGVLLLFLFFAWCFHTGFAHRKRFSSSVSFLCQPFRPIFFWFESFELFRKLTLTSVFVLVNQEYFSNAKQIFSLACGWFLVALFMLKPYKDTNDQLLAELSIFLLLTLGIVSTFEVEQGEISAISFVVLGFEILFFFLCIPYKVIWAEFEQPDEARIEFDDDDDGKKVRHKKSRFRELVRRRNPERSVELTVYPDTRSISLGEVDLEPIKFNDNAKHIAKS